MHTPTGPERNGASLGEIETIYRDRFAAFVRTATALVMNPQEALDVVQDAFASAVRERRSFRGNSLEAWIWRILINKVNDHHRKAKRDSKLAVPIALQSAPRTPDTHLRQTIKGLPEQQRRAVYLYYFADMSYADIAAVLGVRVGTVSASLNAARSALRRGLEGVL